MGVLCMNTLFAHKVNLFITHDKNRVNIYSYFASGDACKECKLLIKNGNTLVLNTVLNKEGKYQYESAFEELTIIVDASSGHLVEKKMTINQIKNPTLNEVLHQENQMKYFKIVLALLIMALLFYGLKRVKTDAK
jgi:nickel transport protein